MMLSQAIDHLIEVARSRDETMAGLGQVSEDARAIRVLLDALLFKPGPGQVVEALRAELGPVDDDKHYPPVKTYKDRLDVLERQMKILLRGAAAFPPPGPVVSNPRPSADLGEATRYEVNCIKHERVRLTLIEGNELMLSDVQASELIRKLKAAASEIPF